MKPNKLIIVDDDPMILELLKGILGKSDYEIVVTVSPKQALKLFLDEPSPVILLDLNMKEMSGKDLMLKIFESEHKPVVLILTSETSVNTAVDLFKIGAHDYLVKPINSQELTLRVAKAFEFAELRAINENIQKEREVRIEHQLNWNLFKENLIKKDSDKVDSGLVTNINTSLIQGAGIGMLAPLVRMIKESMREENETYIIDKELMDLVFQNVDFSSRLTGTISDIDYVINNELPKEEISLSELHSIIENTIKEIEEYQKEKNHVVKLSNTSFEKNPRKIKINQDYFKIAVRELLFNAYKFSETESKIFILFEIVKDDFLISFLNTPEKGTSVQNGIPEESQSVIFEPFFRISRHVFEKFPTLDFGLGLCHVEKIMRNHNGSMRVTNLKNFLENTNRVLINFSMEFPLAS